MMMMQWMLNNTHKYIELYTYTHKNYNKIPYFIIIKIHTN